MYADDGILDIETGKPIDWTYGGVVELSDIRSEKNANAPLLKETRF